MVGRRFAAAMAVMGASLASPAWAVPTSFVVGGRIGTPTTDTAASLQTLPQATQTVTYRAGGSPVTDSFTGPTLWNVLQGAGGITSNPANKNDILRQYVLATGSDGYTAAISAGEISPRFGNRQDLVATSDTLNQLPTPSGFARVVATGDVQGGRYVSNLTSLTVLAAPVLAAPVLAAPVLAAPVLAAPAQPGVGGGVSSSIAVQGAVATPIAFTLASLKTLTPYTETVTYLAGAGSVTDTYTGALLWDVLNTAGVQTDASIKNDILRKLVTATGTDGYQVDVALGEMSPSFSNVPFLVAYADTAGTLATDGFARMVVPGDGAGGRYVSNLESLTVFDGTAVPEPGSWALLSVAVSGLCLGRGRVAAVLA